MKDIVDRTYEHFEPDGFVLVTLKCGHQEQFWVFGLTDKEYIKRTKELKKLNQ